jgi:hypothetical protein
MSSIWRLFASESTVVRLAGYDEHEVSCLYLVHHPPRPTLRRINEVLVDYALHALPPKALSKLENPPLLGLGVVSAGPPHIAVVRIADENAE